VVIWVVLCSELLRRRRRGAGSGKGDAAAFGSD
jgi:hypothetical protein